MTRLAVCAFALAALVVCPPAAGAEAEFADALCPAATAPVRQFNAMFKVPDTAAEKVAGQAAIAAMTYDDCGRQAQSNRQLDVLHYSMVRGAELRVVQGRILLALDEADAARIVLTKARNVAGEVADWQRSAQNVYQSNNENVGSGSTHNSDPTGYSFYRKEAIQVRAAAFAELAKLAAPATPSPAGTP